MATVVEGDQKTPFSIATTPYVGDGATPFPGLVHFILVMELIMLSVKQGCIKYHFKAFGMKRPGIGPRSPRLLANSVPVYEYFCVLRNR